MTTAGMRPLLPTSQNDPSGLGRVEAFWNSFSSILRSQYFSQFQLSPSAKPRWVPVPPVRSRDSMSALGTIKVRKLHSLLEPILCRLPVLAYAFVGLTTKLRGAPLLARRLQPAVS